MSYRALEDMFPDVSTLSGNEKSNTGRSDRSNRVIWGFCQPVPFFLAIHDLQQTESNSFYREIFFYSLRKTFGRLSDTSKKAERTSAVSPEHYTPNKVFPPIFPLGLCR